MTEQQGPQEPQALHTIQESRSQEWKTLAELKVADPWLAELFSDVRRDGSNESRHAKFVQLADAQATKLLLVLSLESIETNRTRVKLRVYPAPRPGILKNHIPQDLVISLMAAGQVLGSTRAMASDRCLMLRQFTCDPGDTFSLQLQLQHAHHIEQFSA
ncbi:MAG: DUF1822 family protein [Cyanobacteria bacterium P01_H01_bin.121]